MNLLNSVFNIDKIEAMKVNRNYLFIFLAIVFLLGIFLIIKKDYYYENIFLKEDDNYILLVEKNMVNLIKNRNKILVNKIESDYSINNIIDKNDTCYVYIKLSTTISNIQDNKYQVLIGKETIFEYIVRVIRKK